MDRTLKDNRFFGPDPVRFLVVGRAGMDFYADPPGSRIEGAGRFVAALGGSAANIAVALVRQGCGAALASAVSRDAVGRFVRGELRRYGVDDRYVIDVEGEFRTSLAVVETRDEDCQSVIYRNGAADFQLGCPDFAAGQFGAVVLTGTVFAAEPSRSVGFQILARAAETGTPVVLDVDYRRYSWGADREAAEVCGRVCAGCDIIVGNDEEFGMLAGGYEGGLGLARVMGKRAVVVYKMGARGAVTFSPGGDFDSGIYQVRALKPTGAGDGFMGGFLAGLATGDGLQQAVARGSATAAMVVTEVGCAPAMPDTAALALFMADHRMTEGRNDAYSTI